MHRACLRITGCLALLAVLTPCLLAQNPPVPCQAQPEVRQALSDLPQAKEERLKALQPLRTRFPNNLFVERVYMDTAQRPTVKDRDAVIAEYRALAEKNPDNPYFAYMAARSLYGVKTKEAIAQFEKLTSTFAWANLSLADAYQTPAFKDLSKVQSYVEAFINACPASYEPYRYTRSIQDKDFLAKSATKLRAMLKDEKDPDNLGNYATLWALEFRVKSPEEHAALRTQIAADLARLRQTDGGKSRPFYSAMQNGYKQVSDEAGTKWADEQLKANAPQTGSAGLSAAYSAWSKEHPSPKATDPADKKLAYYREQLKATDEWMKQYANENMLWNIRMSAVRNLPDAPADAVLTTVEGYLKSMTTMPGATLSMAGLLADRNIVGDRTRQLLKQAVAEIEKPPARDSLLVGAQGPTWSPDYYAPPPSTPPAAAGTPAAKPATPPAKLPNSMEVRQASNWSDIARIAVAVNDTETARSAIAKVQPLLDKNKPEAKLDLTENRNASAVRQYASAQAAYFRAQAELAKLDGRKQDALTDYQSALMARVKTYEPDEGASDPLAASAQALWKELGGTASGWKAWYDARADLVGGPLASASSSSSGPAWQVVEKKIPEFNVKDLSGATWTLASFKGKTVLINVWATW